MPAPQSSSGLVCLALTCLVVYIAYVLFYRRRAEDRYGPANLPPRVGRYGYGSGRGGGASGFPGHGPCPMRYQPEFYKDPALPATSMAGATTTTTTSPVAPVVVRPPAAGLQEAIDFSDITATEQDRADALRERDLETQVETVNERFDAAKRRVTENKLKFGVFDNPQRRKLVETLLRRPECGRRVRSWRLENSDRLRGDVIPKGVSSWGLMRMGRNNPSVDLHAGALGKLAGLGQWNSEENIPDNLFPEYNV